MVIVFDHEIILMRSRLTSVAFDWEMFIGFIFKKMNDLSICCVEVGSFEKENVLKK